MAQMTENPFDRLEQKIDAIMALVQQIVDANSVSSKPAEKEFLTVSETADFLNCSKAHVYVLKKSIPSVDRGARVYFKRSDLVNYLNAGRVVPDKRMAINRRR